jgi:hypothetical protein
VLVSARVEAELAELEEAERTEYLESLGVTSSGLERLIGTAYRLLGLITFLTVGPTEARAWTVSEGATAPEAAGTIHTDFERGFIKAEVIAYDDYVAGGGESLVPVRPGACASRAASTASPTVTSSTSATTSERVSPNGAVRARSHAAVPPPASGSTTVRAARTASRPAGGSGHPPRR